MRMVLSTLISPSTQRRNISDNNSMGSLPDGPCPNTGVTGKIDPNFCDETSMNIGIDLSVEGTSRSGFARKAKVVRSSGKKQNQSRLSGRRGSPR